MSQESDAKQSWEYCEPLPESAIFEANLPEFIECVKKEAKHVEKDITN